MNGKTAVILIAIIFLVFTGCSDKQAPSGYSILNTQNIEKSTVTTYTGKTTREKALKDFVKWAEKGGWELVDDSNYTGTLLERKEEIMLIQASDYENISTVIVVVAPKDQ